MAREPAPQPPTSKANDDALRAIRFLALKFVIFGVLPLLVAALVVFWRFG